MEHKSGTIPRICLSIYIQQALNHNIEMLWLDIENIVTGNDGLLIIFHFELDYKLEVL